MSKIKKLAALEILDSRGRPTIKTTCELESGAIASASVPSGASTGQAEAWELRDGDMDRYQGKGCLNAVSLINSEISGSLSGQEFESQQELDRQLISLDGTPHKSRLGGNSILSVSVAFARAQAAEKGIPLYQHFSEMLGEPITQFPRLTINLFSGGMHAGRQVPIQDVLIVPVTGDNYDEALVLSMKVYHSAVELIQQKFNMRWLTADEGGLSPSVNSAEELMELAVESIQHAGLIPGKDVCLALDVASSHFYQDGKYFLGETPLSSEEMINKLCEWTEKFPIVSIEDGLSEEDWEHWPSLQKKLGSSILILGDDLLCTNPERIQKAIELKSCNALLLKVNQIGTLTEAAEAYRLAKASDWQVTISVRSGDTEDNWFSDLAIGWSGDQSKAGSLTQSERLSKYNRLLEIEKTIQHPFPVWPEKGK
jgi:enolase 1/2/3